MADSGIRDELDELIEERDQREPGFRALVDETIHKREIAQRRRRIVWTALAVVIAFIFFSTLAGALGAGPVSAWIIGAITTIGAEWFRRFAIRRNSEKRRSDSTASDR